MKKVENCTAVILTGGESRRMGSDKASTLLAGKPLLQHVIEQLEPLFSDILISVRTFRNDVTQPQIVDDSTSRGPMVGIKSAMEVVRSDWVFVIACDMPFVSTKLIEYLASQRGSGDVVLTYVDDRPQPLFGFYAVNTCLPRMRTGIAGGQRSMMRLLDQLDVFLLAEAEANSIDPQLNSLMSLDSLGELKREELKRDELKREGLKKMESTHE